MPLSEEGTVISSCSTAAARIRRTHLVQQALQLRWQGHSRAGACRRVRRHGTCELLSRIQGQKAQKELEDFRATAKKSDSGGVTGQEFF